MKKKKIAGIILLIVGFFCVINGAAKEPEEPAVLVQFFAGEVIGIVGVVLLWKSRKPSARVLEKRRLVEEKRKMRLKTVACKHFVGLPLSEGSAATLFFGETALQISGGGNQFSLAYAKVYSMEVKTEVEIQRAYVSSAGGAIGGAALFGPIGGMIGGRVKEKRSTRIEEYLIISYDKDGDTQYMSFSINGKTQINWNIDQIGSCFSAPKHTVL